MASLLGWLAYDGARTSTGAAVASGKAWFYQPGTTSTQVTVFSDADGLYALTQPVSLDAGGRAVVYTDRVVQCEVQTAAGATVRLSDRANAVQAAQVEIQNTVATGTDLTTGAQVAGGRTDLNTFLSNLRTSFGAADGQVLVGTAAQNLRDVLSGSSSVFYTVTNTTYAGGAVGDDSNDDTAEIQAAINAASNAGGGIVYFPPGTYKVSSALTISTNKIRLLGAGAGVTTIKQYGASAYILNVSGADAVIDGITLNAAGVATGRTLIATGDRLRVYNCNFNQGTNNAVATCITTSGSGSVDFFGCSFTINATTQFMLTTGVTTRIHGGRIECTVNSPGTALSGSCVLIGVELKHSGTGTLTIASFAVFIACFATVGAVVLASSVGGVEAGCRVEAGLGLTLGPGYSTSRLQLPNVTSGSATTYAPDTNTYGVHDVTSTGATFEWSTPTGTPQSGQHLILRYKNTSGGAITPTFAAAYKMTAVSVGNNQASSWLLFYNGTNWAQVGTTVAYAA